MTYDIKLVAYQPNGARIGELPQPIAMSSADPLSDTPSMTLTYSKHSVGAQHLSQPLEIAREVYDPAAGSWFEPPNGRFLVLRTEGDRLDATGNLDYICPGYSWLLSKVVVHPVDRTILEGQVSDAELTESNLRAALNAREQELGDILGIESPHVEYDTTAPSSTSNNVVWVDTTNASSPVAKLYRNNAWTVYSSASSAALAAYQAYGDHQVSQGQLRDAQGRLKRTKRTFIGKHAGQVFAELIAEAQARGDRLTGMSFSFTETHDSAGNPWPSTPGNIEVNVGSSLLKLMQTFVSTAQLDYRTDGRRLDVYLQDTALNRDLSDSVVLRYGYDIDEAPDRGTWENLAQEILFLGEEGLAYTRQNPEAPKPWGTWEGSVSQSGVDTEAAGELLAQGSLEEAAGQRIERTRALLFKDDQRGSLPYVDYLPGDYVLAPGSDGSLEPQRIEQITLSKGGRIERIGGNLVLNDRFLEREIRNQRTTEALMGGSGSLGGTGGQRQQETYVDLRTPEAPRFVVGTSETNARTGGGYESILGVEWWWSRLATNGTQMTDGVSHFQVQYRLQQEGTGSAEGNVYAWRNMANVDGEMWSTAHGPVDTFNPITGAPAVYELRVRAFGLNGKVSGWSSTSFVQVETDTEPPEQPSRPSTSVEGSVVYVAWDGKNVLGGGVPLDFSRAYVQEALIPEDAPFEYPVAGGDPTLPDSYLEALTWTSTDTYDLRGAGTTPVLGRTVGRYYSHRLVQVDAMGNESVPSPPSNLSMTVALVDDAQLQSELDAAAAENEQVQQQLDQRLTTAEGDLDAAELELGELDSRTSAAESRLTTAEGDITAAEGRLTTAESNISTLDADLGTLETNLATVETTANNAESSAAQAGLDAQAAADAAALAQRNVDALIASADSLVIGGDFEQDLEAYSQYRQQVADPYSGSWVLGLPSDAQVNIYFPRVTVRPDMEMRGTLVARHYPHDTGDIKPYLGYRIHFEDGTVDYVYREVITEPTLTASWQTYEFAFPAIPANAVAIEPRLYTNGYTWGTSTIYIDYVSMVDVSSYKQAMQAAETAQQEAEAAAADALEAYNLANTAQSTADGKNSVVYRTTGPQGVGLKDGDTWFHVEDVSGIILAHWVWSSATSSWEPKQLDGAQIANFDAGYITSGYLDVANRVQAGSILADKVLLGIGENLIPWASVLAGTSVGPHVAYGADSEEPTLQSPASTNNANPWHLLFKNNTAGTGSRYIGWLASGGQHTSGDGRDFPVEAGRTYRLSVHIRLGGSYTEGSPSFRFQVGYRDAGATVLSSELSTYQLATWDAEEYVFEFTPPAGAESFYVLMQTDRPGAMRIINPSLRVMSDGDLIVNGSVQAEHLGAKSVTADKVLIGGGGNLFPDPNMTSSRVFDSSYLEPVGTGMTPVEGSWLVPSGTGQRGWYANLTDPLAMTPVTPGGVYRVGAYVRTADVAVPDGVRIYVRAYKKDMSAWAFADPLAVFNDVDTPRQVWHKISGLVTAPEGYDLLQVGFYCSSLYEGAARFSSPFIQSAVNGSLVVDGTIDTAHLNVTGEMAAEIGSFMDLQTRNFIVTGDANLLGETYIKDLAATEISAATIYAEQLAVTGTGTFDQAVIDQLWTQQMATKKLYAENVIVGAGYNLIPNGDARTADAYPFSVGQMDHGADPTILSGLDAPGYFYTTENTGRVTAKFAVQPAAKYELRLSHRAELAGQRFYWQLRWYAADGTQVLSEYLVSNREATAAGVWDHLGPVERTAPAGAVSVTWTLYGNHTNGTQGGTAYWGDLYMAEKVKGELIVDGTIKTEHIDTQNFSVSQLLEANEISATYLKVDEIKDAIRIDSQIFSGQTYYGATFRAEQGGGFYSGNTSPGNAYVALDSQGLYSYNANDELMFWLDSNTGRASMVGQMRTGWGYNPSIIIAGAGDSWNSQDQAVWFTNTGTAVGFNNADGYTESAGMWTSGSGSTAYRLQLRGFGTGVRIWNSLELSANRTTDAQLFSAQDMTIWSENRTELWSGNNMLIKAGYNTTATTTRMHLEVPGSGGFIHLSSAGFSRYARDGSGIGSVNIASDGALLVSTSARKTKTQIEDLEPNEAIWDARPVSYVGKQALEHLHELEAKGVRTPEDQARMESLKYETAKQWGFIADEIDELGLRPLVAYDMEGEVANLHYERFIAALFPYLKMMWEDYKERHPEVLSPD